MTSLVADMTEHQAHPFSGGHAGRRRMPIGCGAERNGPRLGNTGALTTGFLIGVR